MVRNKENFPNVNDYRNPIVAEALSVLVYINKFNRGIARVQEELEENGNSKAEFDVKKLTVFSVIVNDNTTQKASPKTTKKTTQKLLEVIKNNPSATRNEIATTIGISEDAIKWQITKLKKLGIIKEKAVEKMVNGL